MSDYENELRHDGWQYEEPPTADEQAAIDEAATAAAGPIGSAEPRAGFVIRGPYANGSFRVFARGDDGAQSFVDVAPDYEAAVAVADREVELIDRAALRGDIGRA